LREYSKKFSKSPYSLMGTEQMLERFVELLCHGERGRRERGRVGLGWRLCRT
jgi:hypothetical protein